MTDADLAAVRKRLEAVTAPAWRSQPEDGMVLNNNGTRIADCNWDLDVEPAGRNADFIGHAPADIAALLAEVELLRAILGDKLQDDGPARCVYEQGLADGRRLR